MNNDAISRSALLSFPIRANHYDKENGDVHFICGIETVMEYAEGLPRLNVAPEWISVEDSLPERDTRVLVCAQEKGDGFEGEHVIAITSYTDNLFGYNISSWIEPWQYFFESYEITHWMPLPEPPSTQEDRS